VGSEEDIAPVRAGDVLARKYRVERVLGVGGMGVVVAATHLQLSQRVALKFLLPDALANPEVVARFAREARAAAQIRSEHVARVLDVGELDSGLPYMVMEFLEGRDLAQELEAQGVLGVEEAVTHVLHACEAIAEAHAAGIVHRDLKPANLFLARRADGSICIKVLDFGISKSPIGVEGDLTKTQGVLGSPLYMSPEQMTASRTVDVRTDVWALGIILYESLTGGCPFQAETMPELVAAILSNRPLSPSATRAEIPALLSQVILRCLEKERDARYGNVAELCAALERFAAPESRVSVARVSRVLGATPSRTKKPEGARLGQSFSFDDGPSGDTVHLPRRIPGARTGDAASWGSTAAAVPRAPRWRPPVIAGLVVVGLGVGAASVTAAVRGARQAAHLTPRSASAPPPVPPSRALDAEVTPGSHGSTADASSATPPPAPTEPPVASASVPIAAAARVSAAARSTAPLTRPAPPLPATGPTPPAPPPTDPRPAETGNKLEMKPL